MPLRCKPLQCDFHEVRRVYDDECFSSDFGEDTRVGLRKSVDVGIIISTTS